MKEVIKEHGAAILTGLMTAIGGVWLWVTNRQRQKAETETVQINNNSLIIGEWVRMVTELKAQIVELEAAMRAVENELQEVRKQLYSEMEQSAKLRAELHQYKRDHDGTDK
jgi:predicted  nucleic acid-binding Zn-ribbon protein